MDKIILVITVACFIYRVTDQCAIGRYGQTCKYSCHCAELQPCNNEMGCAGHCDKGSGWDGPTCQRQNVVLNRPVVQGPRRYCEWPQCFDAAYAVDGLTGNHVYNTPCSLVESSLDKSVKAWWNVTLDQEYNIYRFALYNRKDAVRVADRINGFILSVGRSSAPRFDYKDCYRDNHTGEPPTILYGTCINNTSLKGDVIQVKQTTGEPLTMCELLVYVCAAGWYGDQCDKECNTTTTCTKCDAAQMKCEECVAGGWSEHCDNTCYCLGGVSCNKTSGSCPEGKCAAGYKGASCNQACDAGEYGPNCSTMCGFCYAERETCNITNGHCPNGDHRCDKGYLGKTCKEACPADKWDFDCSSSCGSCRDVQGCNKTSGNCPKTAGFRCKPGYAESDDFCKTECAKGTWGDNCKNNCSENCEDFPCQKENGFCPNCRQGYTGNKCENECPSSLWGYNCSETCSPNCFNGYASCNHLNGTCMDGCVKEFNGTRCQLAVKTTPPAGIIGGSVAGVIAAIIIIVVVVVMSRRRRNQKTPTEGHTLSALEDERTTPQIPPKQDGTVYQNINLGPKPGLKPTPIASPTGDNKNKSAVNDDKDPQLRMYGNSNVTSTSVPIENFWEYVAKKKANDELKVEFEKLPAGPQLKHDVAFRPENKMKNRYKNLMAYDHSRVVLNTLDENMNTDYINACFIDGFNQPKKYIASQGPTEVMINDFLRMIFEQNSERIVMVTNLFEDSKLKCLKYWPEADSETFGLIEVTLQKEEQFADYVVRQLRLTHLKTKKTNKVKQFHFTSWPDHGVPTYADGILDFRDKVNYSDTKFKGPILVHCSAGVGRTGTYIALDYLLQEAQEIGSLDLTSCIRKLRDQRVNLIQTEAQYVFLHEALVEAFRMSDSSISSVDFTNAYKELSSVNPKTGRKRLAEQFKELCSAIPASSTSNKEQARNPANIDKNRHRGILPDAECRAYLSTPVPGGTDYINAVFLPAYKTKKGFIITQMPLTNTVVDFWRLVYDHSVKTIVMLNTEEDNDETVGVYWPDESEQFGPFEVSLTDQDTTRDDFHILTYRLKYNKKEEGISVKQFRCKFWLDPMSQNSVGSALTLIDQILPRIGKDSVIVHCMDGLTKSGLFCTSCAIIEKIKMDFDVNILQAVKKMRIQRPETITDLEQYDFLHKLVLGCLESFQVYANFAK